MSDSNRARPRKRAGQSADPSRVGKSGTPGITWDGPWRRNDFLSDNEYTWAIYLRLMCFRWEYRPQAFVLLSRPICPTFWLPDLQGWLFIQDANALSPEKYREVRSVVNETDYPAGIASTCEVGAELHLVVGGNHQPKGILLAFDGLLTGTPFARRALEGARQARSA